VFVIPLASDEDRVTPDGKVNGEVREQVVRFVIAGVVEAEAKPSPLGGDVAPCAHLARVFLGWRNTK
jgi:hypothetical protein